MMKGAASLLLLGALVAVTATESIAIPSQIYVASDANEGSAHAAGVIKSYLALANISTTITKTLPAQGTPVFAVGYDAAIQALQVPASRLDACSGNDSYVLSTKYGSGIAVASSKKSMRGSMLAAYRLLTLLGFEFIAPDETVVPSKPTLDAIDIDFVPVFESRDNDEWPVAHNPSWAEALGMNGMNAHGSVGGFQKYAYPPGFVHTSYNLLAGESSYDVTKCKRQGSGPCEDVYASNPEWFWPKNDSSTYGQLCWSETSLIAKLKQVVRDILSKDPDANIISVSQNDNGNYCKTESEMAIINAEGSPQGPMLRAINAIADDISQDYPHVAIDTLAYQYTRPAPKLTKPRPNVIIRLCSIECNFAVPLTDPSNAPFNKDMEAWAAISNRTYIWNYVTNFASYLQPFPNWWVVGKNVQYFAGRGVAGLFEEGSYTSPGGDMEVLKDYVMGKMLMDPTLNPDTLVDTFLTHYFGPAKPFVQFYMDTFHGAIANAGYYMHESFDHAAPFLTPLGLIQAKQALDSGEKLVLGTRYAFRVHKVKLAIQYVVLLRWDEISSFASSAALTWPFESTKSDEFSLFNATASKIGVITVSEGKCDLECYYKKVFA